MAIVPPSNKPIGVVDSLAKFVVGKLLDLVLFIYFYFQVLCLTVHFY